MPPQDSVRRSQQAKRRQLARRGRLARRVPRKDVARSGWEGGLLLGENVVRTARITEEGATRLTEAGDEREVEGAE